MPKLSLEAWKMNLKLNEPFTISFHTFTHQENILVKLHYGVHTGLGEAAPFKAVTGDSQQEVLGQLRELITPIAQDAPLPDPEKRNTAEFHQWLDTVRPGNKTVTSATRAALDFAWHDLMGKLSDKPVWKLYSRKSSAAPESFTLSIKSPEEMSRKAARIADLYPDLQVLKIKLEGSERDLERAREIRSSMPRPMRFMIDANQGFQNPDEAVRILQEIEQILGEVILVEEPLPKGDLAGMREVKERIGGIQIFADESAAGLDDLRRVIEKDAADGVNIKLQKAGGIWPGRQIADEASKAGLNVMVGCMLEGPLAISAGVHFAVSIPNIVVTDLSADLLTLEHTKRRARFENGRRLPPDAPGLGVVFNEEKLSELAGSGALILEKKVAS